MDFFFYSGELPGTFYWKTCIRKKFNFEQLFTKSGQASLCKLTGKKLAVIVYQSSHTPCLLPFQNTLKMRFTSRITSLELQQTLGTSLDKRTKDTFGPPIGRQLAVFIDDMNIPHPDQ